MEWAALAICTLEALQLGEINASGVFSHLLVTIISTLPFPVKSLFLLVTL